MSDIQAYEGKLVPVDTEGLSVDEWIQKLLKRDELEPFEDSWLEALDEEYYGEYFFYSELNTLFEIVKEEIDSQSLVKVTLNGDGSYDFITVFYNGGTNLTEMLQDGVDELNS